mgnify:CR=1 FL=1
MTGMSQVAWRDQNTPTMVIGSTRAFFDIRRWKVAAGAQWSPAAENLGEKVCLIGATVRNNLFGAEDPVGQTLRIGRQLISDPARRTSDVLGMMAIVLVVAGVAVAGNLILAVVIGIVIAVVSFIWRMSRSIIRRTYTLREVQSRTVRAPELRRLLGAHGQHVVVFELEGPLFFGTAEKVANALSDQLAGEALTLIIDLQRVGDVDSTAVRLLAGVHRRVARAGKRLVLGGLPEQGRVARLLRDFGINDSGEEGQDAGPPIRVFPDVDQALEWAEDRLLESLGPAGANSAELGLESLDMLRDFTPAELMTMPASSRIGSSPPTSNRKPSFRASPRNSGLFRASAAPCASASPSRASIRPWLSTMPVEGESRAAVALSCGSSALDCAALSGCRSCTPFRSD